MKILYCPWRNAYQAPSSSATCVFCSHRAAQEDEANFILKRYTQSMVMLNIYPYNAGHLLAVPYAHKATLADLTPIERADLMEAVSQSTYVLSRTLACEGINVGINMGRASGGSIPDHLHIHSIPRWVGDTNFLVTTAHTKHISRDLLQIYRQLKAAFEAL